MYAQRMWERVSCHRRKLGNDLIDYKPSLISSRRLSQRLIELLGHQERPLEGDMPSYILLTLEADNQNMSQEISQFGLHLADITVVPSSNYVSLSSAS